MHEHPCRSESMSVKRFLEQGGGNFATAQNTPVGTVLPILGVYFDNETYKENPAIVVNSKRANGEDVKIRLSRANVKRISETLSEDENQWIGNSVKALTHQEYPGLGKTGIIWEGVKSTQQSQMQSPVNLNIPTASKNDLSTGAYNWLVANIGVIGGIIPDVAWNKLRELNLVSDFLKYNLIEMKEDFPHLSERARDYL